MNENRNGGFQNYRVELVKPALLTHQVVGFLRVKKKLIPTQERLLDIVVKEHERFHGGPEPPKVKLVKGKGYSDDPKTTESKDRDSMVDRNFQKPNLEGKKIV